MLHRVPAAASHGNALSSSPTLVNPNCTAGSCGLLPMFQYFSSPSVGGYSQAMDFAPVRAGCVPSQTEPPFCNPLSTLFSCSAHMNKPTALSTCIRWYETSLSSFAVVHLALTLHAYMISLWLVCMLGTTRSFWNCRDDNTVPPTDVKGKNLSTLAQQQRQGVCLCC